jgi:membrane protease YdiL (CAAX protease family)
MRARLHPGVKVLIQIGCLFLPGIPAYLWLWPNVEGTPWLKPVQVLVYLYFLIGALVIGRQRWNWQQLGFNRHGLGLSLICGTVLVAGRMLIMYSLKLPASPNPIAFVGLIGDVIFYLVCVGLTEELLFRGVLYRVLDEWRGTRLAIWGSALAFGLYHIGSQGVAGAIGTGFIGLILAAIRWRAGGIIGLIIAHGLLDITSAVMLPTLDVEQLVHISIARPMWLLLGYVLILMVPIYLWKFYHPVNLKRRTT